MRLLRVALAQINLCVGDIKGNTSRIKSSITRAEEAMSDVVLFPELSVTGYPPEDLIFKPEFIHANHHALFEIADFCKDKDLLAVVGFIHRERDISNAAAMIYKGEIVDIYHKIYLPNYGVFDEKRYFKAGSHIPVIHFRDTAIGVNICEDIWYPDGPGHIQATTGQAEILLNMSASPFHKGKQNYRERMYATRAGDELCYLFNCNLVGGQDELVFDGRSTAYGPDGRLVARLKGFEPDFQVMDINVSAVFRDRLKDIRRREVTHVTPPYEIRHIELEEKPAPPRAEKAVPVIVSLDEKNAEIYKALVIGTRDYILKNNFDKVLIAISGGIDSALVAAIAVDALGPEKVTGIYLPTKFSADISGTDAQKLADNLGITLHNLSIQDIFENYLEKLEPLFKGLPFNVAEENMQARIRGNIVMALSNKFGYLVLTTGNKSEMSTGYATLYGDMAGGFAVIKDVLKTRVYALSRYVNREREIIPERIIERPPSAELRPDQKDTDSLPPYEILDRIIRDYVEEDKPLDELIDEIGDKNTVERFVRLIDKNEYKRRQAPPGIKISERAFGRDRRMPIVNAFSKNLFV